MNIGQATRDRLSSQPQPNLDQTDGLTINETSRWMPRLQLKKGGKHQNRPCLQDLELVARNRMVHSRNDCQTLTSNQAGGKQT